MSQYHRCTLLFILTASLIFTSLTNAKEFLSPEELEKWFHSDDELPVKKVNGGELTFLTTKAKKETFHSIINITVSQNSIDNGWTELTQCYSRLDPIYRTAVVYRKKSDKKP